MWRGEREWSALTTLRLARDASKWIKGGGGSSDRSVFPLVPVHALRYGVLALGLITLFVFYAQHRRRLVTLFGIAGLLLVVFSPVHGVASSQEAGVPSPAVPPLTLGFALDIVVYGVGCGVFVTSLWFSDRSLNPEGKEAEPKSQQMRDEE